MHWWVLAHFCKSWWIPLAHVSKRSNWVYHGRIGNRRLRLNRLCQRFCSSSHAYTRSFRAHLLASSALISHLIDESGVALTNHGDALSSLISKNIEVNQLMELESAQLLVDAIKIIIQEDLNDSWTLKLWKVYLRMTHLLRLFLFAERTGDFDLHLYCMEQYIPLFHSAGHFNYAKATPLYVQQMKNLKHNIPEDTYDLYAGKGYYTIRRKGIYFAGNSSDPVIEQDLMRLSKTSGGLTRGQDDKRTWYHR